MIFSNQYANRADRNIHILKDTLEILKKRKYDKDGSAIRIKLSRSKWKNAMCICRKILKKTENSHRL